MVQNHLFYKKPFTQTHTQIYTRPQASLNNKLIKLRVRKKTRRWSHKKRGGGSEIVTKSLLTMN
jgi:hypothetical protein